MSESQAATTYPPSRVTPTRTARPAAISTTPATRIRVPAENGATARTSGLAYCSQFVRRFRNLSIPARKAIRPKAIRRVQKAGVSRVSMSASSCRVVRDLYGRAPVPGGRPAEGTPGQAVGSRPSAIRARTVVTIRVQREFPKL